MLKNDNFNACCKHILALLVLSICTFVFDIIEYKMVNASMKEYLLMFDISVGLQIVGCAVLGFHFGRKESVIPKNSFNRMDIVRLLLIIVCCIYVVERELSWKISGLIIPGKFLAEASIIQQFIAVKLISIPPVIALIVFEILYLVAKHTEKHPIIKKRS